MSDHIPITDIERWVHAMFAAITRGDLDDAREILDQMSERRHLMDETRR